jgi:hypothetical protein
MLYVQSEVLIFPIFGEIPKKEATACADPTRKTNESSRPRNLTPRPLVFLRMFCALATFSFSSFEYVFINVVTTSLNYSQTIVKTKFEVLLVKTVETFFICCSLELLLSLLLLLKLPLSVELLHKKSI